MHDFEKSFKLTAIPEHVHSSIKEHSGDVLVLAVGPLRSPPLNPKTFSKDLLTAIL